LIKGGLILGSRILHQRGCRHGLLVDLGGCGLCHCRYQP